MIKLLFALIIMFFSMTSIAQHLTPRQLYPGLFEDIQLSDIYPDSKTFPDVIPLKDPKKIMNLLKRISNCRHQKQPVLYQTRL